MLGLLEGAVVPWWRRRPGSVIRVVWHDRDQQRRFAGSNTALASDAAAPVARDTDQPSRAPVSSAAAASSPLG